MRSLVFLLGLLQAPLWGMGVGEGGYCSSRLREEAHKTSQAIREDSYGETDRLLSEYENRFDANGGEFSKRLERIRAQGGLWVDGGARAAYPQRQFLRNSMERGVHADTQCLALSIDLRDVLKADLNAERQMFAGAFNSRIADLGDMGSLTSKDHFDVGTDYLGAFSYSQRPMVVFENYIHHLKDDGALYIGTRNDRSYVSFKGKKVSLMEFLIETTPGLNFKKLDDKLGIYEITIKDRKAVKFPYRLALRDWRADLPPERAFDAIHVGSDDDY